MLTHGGAEHCSDSFYQEMYNQYLKYYNALSYEEKLKEDFIFHRNTDDDIKNM